MVGDVDGNFLKVLTGSLFVVEEDSEIEGGVVVSGVFVFFRGDRLFGGRSFSCLFIVKVKVDVDGFYIAFGFKV